MTGVMFHRASSPKEKSSAAIRSWIANPDVSVAAELSLVWLAIAGSVYLSGYVAHHMFGTASWAISEGFPPQGIFGRWDVLNYIRIAEEGYVGAPDYHAVWFPGLPLLMALGSRAGIAPLTTGTAVALLSGALLVQAFYRLALLDLPRDVAKYSVLALLLFPSSFFLFIAYPESPFLLLAVGAFWAARRGHWALAGLLAALASGLRITGVLLAPALLLEYLYAAGWRWRAIRADILWLALAPSGMVAYMGYLAYEFGNPLRFYTAQSVQFDRTVGASGLQRLIDDIKLLLSSADFETGLPIFLGLVALALFAAALPLMVRLRIRISYLAFAVLSIAAPLATGRPDSMNRYILAAFPIFFVMGHFSSRFVALRPLGAIFVALIALSAVRFASYYWVG